METTAVSVSVIPKDISEGRKKQQAKNMKKTYLLLKR